MITRVIRALPDHGLGLYFRFVSSIVSKYEALTAVAGLVKIGFGFSWNLHTES